MPNGVQPLQQQLIAAPRWVICAPEYNGSIPPVLTNAIAWLSVQGDDFRALFNGRPIAIASFSGGNGMELLVSLRIQLTHLGAQVVGRQLLSNYAKPAKDESIADLMQRLMQMTPLQLCLSSSANKSSTACESRTALNEQQPRKPIRKRIGFSRTHHT